MKVLRDNTWFGFWGAIIFGASMFIGGCGATINYSYDSMADFSKGKSYSWASGWVANRQEALIEKNVRYYADRSLQNKGFSLTSDKSDFMISMSYELEYNEPYKMRLLNLYVYKTPNRELIWQGTAVGTIKADAASPELAKTVRNILKNFPPKR